MEQAQTKKSDTLAQVIQFCHDHFEEDRVVQNYLYKTRGLTRETVRRFKLGAFPSNIFRLMKAVDPWELQQSGIIKYVDGKETSKFLHNNVIIPIFDVHDRPIAIIGRTLCSNEEQEQLGIHKYDNTRFSKGACLFGLNFAKNEIRKQNRAIIVEGNIDVITAHQAGHQNVVATSGSWFTKKQMSLVGRYAENVDLMLDNDEAGRRTTKGVLSKPPMNGINIGELKFPEKFKDPDEFFRSGGEYGLKK